MNPSLIRILMLLLLAIMALSFIQYIYGPVSAADNLTIDPTLTSTPIITPSYRVQQMDTVYIGDTVDISGVASGLTSLAYYGGYEEDLSRQYLLELPNLNKDYYHFYIDPAIFSNRLGYWFKWHGSINRNENAVVFVVAERRLKPNVSPNITLQNPNQTPSIIPKVPILPDQYIADYLVAKGDSISIPATNRTRAWIFGVEDYLYDYKAVNGTIDLKENAIDKLSPGSYILLLHTRDVNASDEFTVRYNENTSTIDWFDPITFNVNHYDVSSQTPENVMNKLKSILPEAHDTFKLYSLEVQLPSTSINQIDTWNAPNKNISPITGDPVIIPTYIEVRGYSNADINTVIEIVVDPDLNMPLDQMFKEAFVTSTKGNDPGNMRVFKSNIPIYTYNMRVGDHFLAVRTKGSNTFGSASFYIYENWANKPIANKTIRYISGKYGSQELIPTPTPVVIIRNVTQIVTQIVTVPVTPSDEQVYTQQKLASDTTWWEGAWRVLKGIIGVILILSGVGYIISVLRRLKK
jgi:hypothetical protein